MRHDNADAAPTQPGSDGEHRLQQQFGTTLRAQRFYDDQVLDHLNERMIEFIGRMDMAFIATADDQGSAIDGRCITSIKGRLQPARFWTLTIYDGRGRLIENPAARYAFTSAEVVYDKNGEVNIWLSPRTHAGNWLPTGESERIVAIFRLYDTPTGVARSEAAEMPRITRENCP